MCEVEAIPMMALHSKPNGRRERAKINGVENAMPLMDIESTNRNRSGSGLQRKMNALAEENSSLLLKLKRQEDVTREMEAAMQHLREENSSLQATSSELRLQIQVLEREVKAKGDEVSALQKDLARAQLDAAVMISATEQHAADLQSELDLVRSQRVEVEERVLSMTRNLTRGKSVIEKLTGELMSKISAQERMINSQRTRFDQTAVSCRTSKDETDGRVAELELVVEEQRRDMELLKRRNREMLSELERLESENSDAVEKIARLRDLVQKSEVQKLLSNHKLRIAESVHGEMEEIHKSRVHDLEMRSMKLEAQCEAMHKDLQSKEDKLEWMNRVVANAFTILHENIGGLETSLVSRLRELESRISACSRENENVRELLGTSERRRQELEDELDAVRSENSKLQFQNHELMVGLLSLNQGFVRLETACIEQIESLHSKISRCSSSNQLLREGLEAVACEKSELEVRNHEMMVRVLSLSQGVDMLEMGFSEQVEHLDERLSRCTEANRFLQHGLEVLTSKKKVLELENHELGAKVARLDAAFERLREAFAAQIERLDSEVARCHEDNQAIREGLEMVMSRKRELELQNRELILGLVVLDDNLRRLEMALGQQIEFADYRILKCFREIELVKESAGAVASRKKRELELEKQQLLVKLTDTKQLACTLQEEIESLKMKGREHEHEHEHEKDLRELEVKAEAEKAECRERILELERRIGEMEEYAVQKDEEKRQAIMQLCMQIDYQRERYDNLVRTISTTLW